MVAIDYIIGLDETWRMLQEPHKVISNSSDNNDYISYWRERRGFLPKQCPVCGKINRNYKVIKVTALINNRWKLYITPICTDCIYSFQRRKMKNPYIFVPRLFLCSPPVNKNLRQ